jgi:hypothetical protein
MLSIILKLLKPILVSELLFACIINCSFNSMFLLFGIAPLYGSSYFSRLNFDYYCCQFYGFFSKKLSLLFSIYMILFIAAHLNSEYTTKSSKTK